jgi:CheY-like chemotaxis protein
MVTTVAMAQQGPRFGRRRGGHEPGPDETIAAPRVLVADDKPEIRALVRDLLRGVCGEVVVDEAADGAQALEAVRARRYDVVVMDLEMPVMDGLSATAAAMAEQPALHVVAFSASVTPDVEADALRAGARACFCKTDWRGLVSHVLGVGSAGRR